MGIFSPVFGRFQEGSGNGDGISVTRYFANRPIEGPFPGLERREAFQELLSKAIRDGVLQSANEFDVNLGEGDDIVLPGWQVNSRTKTGPGDDIILSSPQLHIAQMYDTRSWVSNGTCFDWKAYIYYPTAYIPKGTTSVNSRGNAFDTGPGNDLIYYDSGVDRAEAGDGHDVIAPSFGSFNWALDHLIQGSGLVKPPDGYSPDMGYGGYSQLDLYEETLARPSAYKPYARTFIRGERALLSPLRNPAQRQKIPTVHTENTNYGLDGYEFDAFRKDLERPERITIRTSNKQEGVNFGLKKKETTGIIDEDPDEINIMGGSVLVGGKGNDIFYGIDPQFYAGFETAADGKGLRLAFRKNRPQEDKDNTKPPRYQAQKIDKIKMFGGDGLDYFALGNLGNLDPWSQQEGADSIYRISGNSDSFRNRIDWGPEYNADPDIFEANLTYAGENWSNTVISAPGDAGASEPPSASDLVGLGFDGLSTFGFVAGGFGISLPIFSAVTAVGSFAAGIASLFKPTPKQPISTENKYYRDPIGDWRQKISIQDWDPFDSIVIRVDPSDPSSQQENRWDNILLSIESSLDSNDTEALDINYKLADPNSEKKTLFRLEKFSETRNGAWYVWDFVAANQFTAINDRKYLGFFGQVEMQSDSAAKQDPDLESYNDEYGFKVETGTRLFRWTDESLKNQVGGEERLSRMRSRSERIVVQLDTVKPGYSWDPRFKGEVSSIDATNPKIRDLSLDKDASKLWIREQKPNARPVWTDYTYSAIENDTDLQALKRKATPIWSYQTPKEATELVANMQILGEEMNGGLDQLTQAKKPLAVPKEGSSGKLLKPNRYELTNLNKVRDIVIEGGLDDRRAIVYHKAPSKKGRHYAILRTIVDNNIAHPTYGLTQRQLMREEKLFHEDLDANGLIGKMTTNAAG